MSDEAPKGRAAGRLRPVVSLIPRPLIGGEALARSFRVKVLTLFPQMWPGPLGFSLIGRARADGIWSLESLDIRDFARDKHRTVDDTPAGGGPGMVMRPDVVAAAIDAAQADAPGREHWPVIYLSPRGTPISQARVRQLAQGRGMTLICGRFEGIDQRVLDARQVEEICVGDAVLTGGDIPAMALVDATVRLLPGVLGDPDSVAEESFSAGLLEHPQFTRPQEWDGRAIPEVLLSGNHARIAAWRRTQAEAVTQARRPDLWAARLAASGEAEQSGGQRKAKPARGEPTPEMKD